MKHFRQFGFLLYQKTLKPGFGLGSESIIRPTDVSRKGLKFYPWTFFFCQSTVISSHAENGHQIYFGGSVVGKALTTGIGILPNPRLIFTGGQKVQNLVSN